MMLRLEWMKDFSSCLQENIKRIDAMKNYTGVGSTFVAVDVGKYGSKSSGVLNSKSMVEPVQHFLMTIYGNSSSLRDWEQTFEEISKNTSPGYIAFLQKVIATRALQSWTILARTVVAAPNTETVFHELGAVDSNFRKAHHLLSGRREDVLTPDLQRT